MNKPREARARQREAVKREARARQREAGIVVLINKMISWPTPPRRLSI